MAKRWHLESVLQYEDKVDDLILKGIKAVEQKSLAALKKDSDKTAGEAKLDEAMKFVNAQLDKIIDFIRKDGRFYLGPIEREMFGF